MINIVIPMKDPLTSKQRLSSIFDQKERHDFALALFQRTLVFFQKNFTKHHVLVVTNSQKISLLSKRFGASVLLENKTGLSHAINVAAQWSVQQNFTSQLVIPADIAQLDANELKLLLQQDITQPSVIICPSQDNGTNALLTSPPDIIEFCYGRNSAKAHQQQAYDKAVQCRQLLLDKLSVDIDFPVDLQSVITTPQISNILKKIA